MALKNFLHYLLLLFSLAAFISSCKEEITIDNSDKVFPVGLKMEIIGETPVFSWDEARVSSFGGYTLVRSTEMLASGLKPGFGTGTTTIALQTNKRDSLRFEDSSTPFATTLFYKLYIKIGDRFVESPNITFNQELGFVAHSADFTYAIPDSSWLVVFSANSSKFSLYNYATKKVLKTTPIPFLNTSEMAVTDGVENGKRYLYFANSFDKLYKFELPSMVLSNSLTLQSSTFGLAANGNQLLDSKADFNAAISVRRASDLVSIKNLTRNNYFERRPIILIDPVANRYAEISPTFITAFDVSSTGVASNTKTASISSSSGTIWLNTPISPDRQYFIPKPDGIVYGRNLEPLPNVPNMVNVQDYSFSPDGKSLYGLSFSSSFQDAIITKFNFPDMTKAGEKTISMISPRKILGQNDGVVFVGLDNFTFNTFIKKVKF